ncbi:efflux RND transporter periplasmic adaptor subunit [Bradyrhizobium hipponense]|uniref:Efflux RND transporter periplasmic adaptor subunit n=1 Tax=Bradyrhizobium hipponense TaxID=2605638 RepID=A0A5S4YWR9_9BRAD|nr:efflux RND transporter periplasmic adaptor subunit [Bradyrhizobium hipponense]TYO65229.1 efflux RND transporter periplasmic adaptor subunit [Bradyrhizobium hipponense]
MTDDKTKLLRSLTIDRSANKAERSSSRRLPISAAIVACVVAFAAFAAFEFRRQYPPKETASQIASAPQSETPQPERTTTNNKAAGSLAASGYVVARRKATVAAEITGKVVEVFIDEGMTVNDGQIVARLDSVLAEKDYELARSRVETADAAVAAITADLEDATRIMSRVQTLSQKNFATEADLTKAQARVGVLSAQLRQAKSQFETATIDAKRSGSMLDKHQIRAPFAGVVIDRSAQPGEMISPMSVGGYTRTGICTIVDMDSIEIEVDVNEAFIGRVVPGGAVSAMLDAYPDWTIPASVIAIVPTANREKATVKVRIRFDKKDPRILPDMAVKVNFLVEAKGKGAAEATAAN